MAPTRIPPGGMGNGLERAYTKGKCIYLMSLLLYMLKIMKKMNIFCFFKYLLRFADFCRFFPPMLPRRCFLDPCRFFADADVFYYGMMILDRTSHERMVRLSMTSCNGIERDP